MAHTKVTVAGNGNVSGQANTYTYSGSFDVFAGKEVVVTLDGVALTRTTSTINESASPREYTVDTTAKTVHVGGADLGSGNSLVIRPETDLTGTDAPYARAVFTPGASITAEDLNNNQKQLIRKALEYDDTKMSSTGDTMTGTLTMGIGTSIVYEGATDDAYETTLTVTDPTADRTITLPNVTGTVVTTGDTGSVATGMIADDAVDNDKLANSIVSAISANTAKVTNATHTGDVTGATSLTIANDAVTSAKIDDGTIVTGNISASAAIEFTKLENLDSSKILVGNGSNKAAEVVLSGDITINNAGVSAIGSDTVEIGMLDCEQTTISDSDSHIPTSGAVVDYVASQIAPIGGFEVVADDESFPNTQPGTGVVISISDAAGLSINSSGVSTNGDTLDNSTVTINGFPSELRGGVGGNADPYVLGAGTGLMVKSTGSGQIYDYHQVMIKESDFVQLSDDINDFNNRYRIGTKTADDDSSNDDGDLFFDTSANKMYVYDGVYNSGGSWGEVTSTGEFKILGVKDNGQAHNGSGPTFNGSNDQYDLFESTNDANITQAAQLLVVLNGVLQKPNDGSWSGSNEGFHLDGADGIRFCDPPPSGSTLYVTKCGSAVAVNTPADNSVSAGKTDISIVQGDLIYGNGTDSWTRLAKGTAGKVLKMNSGATAPEWADDTGTPEGTAIKSTGESGGAKFLREDGDGTCSWQTASTLTTEQVEDIVGGMLDGTETGITVSYDDTDGNIDFVVAPEGTTVKSTGESGGSKFLREDGDGTCSWQTVSAGTALTGSTNNQVTTVTGANAITGEANLTFDGSNLTVNSTVTTKTLNLDGTVESSPAQGDIWYNNGTFYFGSNIATAWSSGGNMSTGSYVHACTGVQTAGLLAGGWSGGNSQQGGGSTTRTEEYDGTSWSGGGALPGAVTTSDVMCGTQTAALEANQNSNSAVTSIEYDGSSWSSGGNCNSSHYYGSAFGLQTAGVLSGGSPGGTKTNVTEEYDGSSWSSGGNLNNTKQQHGSCGTLTVGLTAGGNDGSAEDDTEEYDGTSWSTGNDMNQVYTTHAMGGTQSDAFAAGGTSDTDGSSLYDGTSWTAAANMSTAHPNTAGGGLTSAGWVAGGSGTQNATSEFNYSTTVNTSGYGGLS